MAISLNFTINTLLKTVYCIPLSGFMSIFTGLEGTTIFSIQNRSFSLSLDIDWSCRHQRQWGSHCVLWSRKKLLLLHCSIWKCFSRRGFYTWMQSWRRWLTDDLSPALHSGSRYRWINCHQKFWHQMYWFCSCNMLRITQVTQLFGWILA